MTTNHIDQLAEWYESAERITKTNLPRSGDYVISPFFNGTGYHIELEPDDWTADIVREGREDARILARAPKPKPAWHDAVAVIADAGGDTCVWVRSVEDDGFWIDGEGDESVAIGDLRNVTPLIEAKVTDEAMQRVFNALDPAVNKRLNMTKEDEEYVRYIVTAALGLETE